MDIKEFLEDLNEDGFCDGALFCPNTLTFFPKALVGDYVHSGTLSLDDKLVPVTSEEYQLYTGEPPELGLSLGTAPDGRPAWVESELFSEDELRSNCKYWRDIILVRVVDEFQKPLRFEELSDQQVQELRTLREELKRYPNDPNFPINAAPVIPQWCKDKLRLSPIQFMSPKERAEYLRERMKEVQQ